MLSMAPNHSRYMMSHSYHPATSNQSCIIANQLCTNAVHCSPITGQSSGNNIQLCMIVNQLCMIMKKTCTYL